MDTNQDLWEVCRECEGTGDMYSNITGIYHMCKVCHSTGKYRFGEDEYSVPYVFTHETNNNQH